MTPKNWLVYGFESFGLRRAFLKRHWRMKPEFIEHIWEVLNAASGTLALKTL